MTKSVCFFQHYLNLYQAAAWRIEIDHTHYIAAMSQCIKWVFLLFQEGKSKDKTRDEITAMISQHVKALNKIYGSETFSGKYKHRNIRFEVQRIKVSTKIWITYGTCVFIMIIVML